MDIKNLRWALGLFYCASAWILPLDLLNLTSVTVSTVFNKTYVSRGIIICVAGSTEDVQTFCGQLRERRQKVRQARKIERSRQLPSLPGAESDSDGEPERVQGNKINEKIVEIGESMENTDLVDGNDDEDGLTADIRQRIYTAVRCV